MTHSLQEEFVRTRGAAIRVGDLVVIQADRIPICAGTLRLTFLSEPDDRQGVCLKVDSGWIELSDLSRTQRLYVWNEVHLPTVVEHRINCSTGLLKLWNIYRVSHSTGEVTEDQWTANAGMVLVDEAPNRRRYRCSDGLGPFDLSDLEFEVQWVEDQQSGAVPEKA